MGLRQKMLEGLDSASAGLLKNHPNWEMALRAGAAPIGAGDEQLEQYGQSPRGLGAVNDMNDRFGELGTSAMLGLAQEGPVGLVTAPIGGFAGKLGGAAATKAIPGAIRSAALKRIITGTASGVAGGAAGGGVLGAAQSDMDPGTTLRQAAIGGLAGGALGGVVQSGAEKLRAMMNAGMDDAIRAKASTFGNTNLDFDPAMTVADEQAINADLADKSKGVVDFWKKYGGRPPTQSPLSSPSERQSALDEWARHRMARDWQTRLKDLALSPDVIEDGRAQMGELGDDVRLAITGNRDAAQRLFDKGRVRELDLSLAKPLPADPAAKPNPKPRSKVGPNGTRG